MTSEERFETFWKAYPRKTGKGLVREIFARLKVDDALLYLMLSALEWQRHQPRWVKDQGEYIPLPATWLRQGRWEDEPFEPMQVEDPWFGQDKRPS
jgi:hypothetical protein